MTEIALAEDHPKMRSTISSLVKKNSDCNVYFEVDNGYDFIMKLNTLKILPQIAILDVQMPIMDGLAVTNFLRSHYHTISVLAISMYSDPFIVNDLLEAGAKGYLLKNNLTTFLKEAIQTLQAGKIYLDEMVATKIEYFQTARINVQPPTYTQVKLTDRETTFLQLTAIAITYEQIADLMNIAKETVYNYQKSLKEKLGLSTRQEYIVYAIQHGIAKVARLNPNSVNVK